MEFRPYTLSPSEFLPRAKHSLRRLSAAALLAFACATSPWPVATAQAGEPAPAGEKAPAGKHSKEDSPEVARRAAAIARQTMSPFCPGRTLSDCPSQYAAEWRDDIRKMVEAGMTPQEIQQEMEKRAGGNLSGIPNREASYAVPVSLAIGAAVILLLIFMRLRKKEEEPEPAPKKKKKGAKKATPGSEIDDDRLAQELEDESD